VDVEAQLLIVLVDKNSLDGGILALGDNDALLAGWAVLFQVADSSGNVVSASDNGCLEIMKEN
jgi:hypothetical protein